MSSWVHMNKNINTQRRVRNEVTQVWELLRLIPNKLPRLKGFPIDFNTLLNMARAHKKGQLE